MPNQNVADASCINSIEYYGRSPYQIAPAEVWKAYEHLEKLPLTSDPVKTLTNLITLVRHTVDPEHQPLAPFPELVEQRYQQWLGQHGDRFDENQLRWLDVIKNYISLNGAFATEEQDEYLDAWKSVDSDEGVPLAVAKRVFGKDPKPIIEELNEVLVA
ncbi:MAG: type I restriction-modification enzyme R subunit C-terminal domain-containing protein [Verrucomicrobiales bacterium]|nr:type I restriction-modification enzyme R subunit C-terminal domain-containing protein [Verrucomicrobiales bacterium]